MRPLCCSLGVQCYELALVWRSPILCVSFFSFSVFFCLYYALFLCCASAFKRARLLRCPRAALIQLVSPLVCSTIGASAHASRACAD